MCCHCYPITVHRTRTQLGWLICRHIWASCVCVLRLVKNLDPTSGQLFILSGGQSWEGNSPCCTCVLLWLVKYHNIQNFYAIPSRMHVESSSPIYLSLIPKPPPLPPTCEWLGVEWYKKKSKEQGWMGGMTGRESVFCVNSDYAC